MSWTRDRLKTNGRIAFKKNYWSCVAVAVIMGIITGLSGVNGGRAGGSASQNSLYGTDGFGYPFAGLAITMTAIIVTLIILALEIFMGSLLEVGGKRFFVLNKTENPTVGTIFDAFRSGHYVRAEDGDVYSGSVIYRMDITVCNYLWNRWDILCKSVQGGDICRIICI